MNRYICKCGRFLQREELLKLGYESSNEDPAIVLEFTTKFHTGKKGARFIASNPVLVSFFEGEGASESEAIEDWISCFIALMESFIHDWKEGSFEQFVKANFGYTPIPTMKDNEQLNLSEPWCHREFEQLAA